MITDDDCPAAFQPQHLKGIFPEVISKAGLSQLRIAETEKYAHVTFFFSGGDEKELPGERRILIPSPKVATYDLQPAMSAEQVTDRLLRELDGDERPEVVILNFAKRLISLEGKVFVNFMEPFDPFGNRVDDQGRSLDARGRVIDTDGYITRNGEIKDDDQRDRVYTDNLGAQIVDSFRRGTTMLTTNTLRRPQFRQHRGRRSAQLQPRFARELHTFPGGRQSGDDHVHGRKLPGQRRGKGWSTGGYGA